MTQINTIIVPVDLLSYTEPLTVFAVDMAQKLGAKLKFIHIVEPVHLYGTYIGPTIEDFDSRLVELSGEKMKKLVESVNKTCPGSDAKITKGDVVESIVDYAKEQEGGLLIIATHGRKGLEKIWLGSVAERVVKNAPCPVLVFNPHT